MNSRQRIQKYGDPTNPKTKNDIVPGVIYPGHSGVNGFRREVKFLCNIAIRGSVTRAFEAACEETLWVPTEIQGYNVRPIRGGSVWSLHSWALAWDIFGASGPVDQVTGKHRPPDEWFHVMESKGFEWGGRWRGRPDPHHVQFSL